MRLSREAMARNHERIVDAAGRLLRERGIEGTSVGDVMNAAGMTHGGFYRHFDSKDALVAAAAAASFTALTTGIDQRVSREGDEAAMSAYVADYLSAPHVAHPERGCPIAALGIEAGRAAEPVRNAFAGGAAAILARFTRPDPEDRQARDGALRQLAMMVGAVVIARAVGEHPLGAETLAACAAIRLDKNATAASDMPPPASPGD